MSRSLSWVIAVAIAGACGGGTTLVDLWKDPVYPVRPLTNILVVNLGRDQATRRIWEDGFVRGLGERGVQAVPSYRLFPTELPDSAQIRAAVRRDGYDGVVATHRLAIGRRVTWVHGYIRVRPAIGYGSWVQHYWTYWAGVQAAGDAETDRVARVQTDVWLTTDGGELVWTGTTRTLNPASPGAATREIVGTIVRELAKQGVIPGKRHS